MRRWIGRVCIGLGGFLLVAGVLGLVWAPGAVEKTPLDVDKTTYLEGTAGKIDLETGELVYNDIYALSVTKTDTEVSTDDTVAWVSTSCVMIDRGGERECVDGSEDMITAGVDVFATDRVTALAVNEGIDLPADATPHEGLVNKFPFGAEEKTYPYWDGLLKRTVDAEFDRNEEIDGLDLNVYKVELVDEPAEVAAGTQGSYSTVKEIFVEPRTGSIVNQTEDQQRFLADGTQVLDLQIAFTPDQMATSVEETEESLASLNLLTKTVPLVGLVGGPILVVLGLVLARRRQATATPQAPREMAGAGR